MIFNKNVVFLTTWNYVKIFSKTLILFEVMSVLRLMNHIV